LNFKPVDLTTDKPSKEIAEIELNKISTKFDSNESSFKTFEGFQNLAGILQNFEQTDTKDGENKQQETLLLKFLISDSIQLSPKDLEKLNERCQNKSVVIVIESLLDNKSIIYWKLSAIEEFFIFKTNEELNSGNAKKLNGFVANFLADSVKNNHLGMVL